ncbi:MAG: protein-L-isoaspartate(D-aspartate) O-methyltransferase [Bacteroidota bacterium]
MDVTKEEMIENQLIRRGIKDPDVLQAMREIDRELFIPEEMRDKAYYDGPLPIGKGQTISQPYIVAYMAQELKLKPDDIVLEIGTGCGYNAAVMSKLVSHVYSIEVIEWLAEYAKENLETAGIENISTRWGDGYKGWPEEAPFDAIILTAAPAAIPEPLKEQLKIGGRLLAPVGVTRQSLNLLTRTGQDTFIEKELILVSFVPMTGRAQQ